MESIFALGLLNLKNDMKTWKNKIINLIILLLGVFFYLYRFPLYEIELFSIKFEPYILNELGLSNIVYLVLFSVVVKSTYKAKKNDSDDLFLATFSILAFSFISNNIFILSLLFLLLTIVKDRGSKIDTLQSLMILCAVVITYIKREYLLGNSLNLDFILILIYIVNIILSLKSYKNKLNSFIYIIFSLMITRKAIVLCGIEDYLFFIFLLIGFALYSKGTYYFSRMLLGYVLLLAAAFNYIAPVYVAYLVYGILVMPEKNDWFPLKLKSYKEYLYTGYICLGFACLIIHLGSVDYQNLYVSIIIFLSVSFYMVSNFHRIILNLKMYKNYNVMVMSTFFIASLIEMLLEVR